MIDNPTIEVHTPHPLHAGHIVVHLLIVCQDGEHSTSLHRNHQDAANALLCGWGRHVEDHTVDDLAAMGPDQLSDVFADAGVDFGIEEIRIDLRAFLPGAVST